MFWDWDQGQGFIQDLTSTSKKGGKQGSGIGRGALQKKVGSGRGVSLQLVFVFVFEEKYIRRFQNGLIRLIPGPPLVQ